MHARQHLGQPMPVVVEPRLAAQQQRPFQPLHSPVPQTVLQQPERLIHDGRGKLRDAGLEEVEVTVEHQPLAHHENIKKAVERYDSRLLFLMPTFGERLAQVLGYEFRVRDLRNGRRKSRRRHRMHYAVGWESDGGWRQN